MRCHHDVYTRASAAWSHLQLRGTPDRCPYCGAPVKVLSQHRCPVLCQTACIQDCIQSGVTDVQPDGPVGMSRKQRDAAKTRPPQRAGGARTAESSPRTQNPGAALLKRKRARSSQPEAQSRRGQPDESAEQRQCSAQAAQTSEHAAPVLSGCKTRCIRQRPSRRHESKGGEGYPSPHLSHGENDLAARGRAQRHGPGVGGDGLYASGTGWLGGHDQGVGSVASQDQGGLPRLWRPGGEIPAPHDDGRQPLYGVGFTIGQSGGLNSGSSRSSIEARQTTAPDTGRQEVAVSPVVTGEREAGAHRGRGMGHQQSAPCSAGDRGSSSTPECRHPIPRPQGLAEVQCQGWSSRGSVEADHRAPGRDGQSLVQQCAPSVGQRPDAACFDPHEASHHETQWPCSAPPAGPAGLEGETLRTEMMQWAFINSSVWCYMNACVWGTMWSLTFTCRPARAWGALQGVATVAQLSSGLPFKLTKCPAVQQALREWHSLHPGSRQQDGAEFCTVVLAKLVGISWGSYEARCQFDEPEKHALHQPVLLQLPKHSPKQEAITLQALILDWHEATGKLQALTSPHEALCLQLERCSDVGTKNRHSISVPRAEVLIPTFGGPGLQVEWRPYQVRAMLMHKGERACSGHFRTILIQEKATLLADDGCQPAACRITSEDERDLYMLWLTPSSQAPGPEYPVQPAGISPPVGASIQHILTRFF